MSASVQRSGILAVGLWQGSAMNNSRAGRLQWAVLGALALLLAVVGCDGREEPAIADGSPPCAGTDSMIDPCEPRDMNAYALFTSQLGVDAEYSPAETASVEDVLAKG